MKRSVVGATAAVMLLAGLSPSQAAQRPRRARAPKFAAPVKLTPANAGGYEPGITTDKFGNLFVTAHKENAELIASPDSGSPTMTRSMSWKWMSADNGLTWKEVPGLPLNLENHDFGDEGDLATDASHLYFVDTNVADVTFTRWTISGRDQVKYSTHRPALPTAQSVDDRPWITAHGDGDVYYLGNQGDKTTYPFGKSADPSNSKGGRYTLYASHNAGDTFDPIGLTLPDSGWCRPEADPKSSYVYVFCTNDGGSNDVSPLDTAEDTGHLFVYVSPDKGATWHNYRAGTYFAHDPASSWPSVQVAPDGSLWALYMDAEGLTTTHTETGNFYASTGNKLWLYHSVTHGKTWTRQDVTPEKGQYRYSWVSIAPDSKTIGITTYHRSRQDKKWRVFATLFRNGTKAGWTSIDDANPVAPETASGPPGDFLECRFSHDGALNVVWTRDSITQSAGKATATLFRDIYFARSLSKAATR
ncbi:MAG: hypothetical protein NVSMB57_00730 [Actinomycetota bacterium]